MSLAFVRLANGEIVSGPSVMDFGPQPQGQAGSAGRTVRFNVLQPASYGGIIDFGYNYGTATPVSSGTMQFNLMQNAGPFGALIDFGYNYGTATPPITSKSMRFNLLQATGLYGGFIDFGYDYGTAQPTPPIPPGPPGPPITGGGFGGGGGGGGGDGPSEGDWEHRRRRALARGGRHAERQERFDAIRRELQYGASGLHVIPLPAEPKKKPPVVTAPVTPIPAADQSTRTVAPTLDTATVTRGMSDVPAILARIDDELSRIAVKQTEEQARNIRLSQDDEFVLILIAALE